MSVFLTKVFGKLFGDKGYISEDLRNNLFERGVELIASVKNNMKNTLMPMIDKLLFRKRSIVETINDQLKNICQIEYSRHRSSANLLTNVVSGFIYLQFFV
ncbi:transposase [Ichthyobacterium seriolicida]|uniref:Transposase n=1 Tax=Ichthyobacterium seriolicida TaxID=242600 RepID=A0A1J1DY36_9FLAO|nr:transposase [Ichthyobacterium seriolicida]BAV94802.1 transposase [Ichthyobacterium seriolicida]